MKKRRIQAMFTALTAAAVFFTGCPTGHGNTGESGDPNSEDGKTYILFQNANPYAVDVYSDSGRGNKAAAVPADGESKLEWTPNPDGSSFYLTYQIPVGDDVVIPYNSPPIGPYRIDEGKTTSIAIASPVSSPDLLTDRVYLLLYNESGGEAFRLEQQGGTVIKPERIFSGNESVPDSISLVNPDERAWYIISAGSAAAYSVSASGTQKPFPNSDTGFQPGWFYTFRYRDGGLVPDTTHPLSLEELPSRISLQAALARLDSKAEEGGVYTITISDNESIGPQSLSYSGKTVSITLSGGMAERTISLSSNGSLFTVGSGVMLTLSNNVTLQGRSSNTSPLVVVSNGGTLVMESSSKLNGNSNYSTTATYPSAASASTYGGGVYVDGGTFTMSGGTISDNRASTSGSFSPTSSGSAYGGGVYVDGGTFTMSGGTISGNSAGANVNSAPKTTATSASAYGGGVYVSSGGTFTMSGGTISGNNASTISGSTTVASASAYGGGVSVHGGTFTMSSGTISSNRASAYSGSISSAPSASAYGGGVSVDGGTFTMSSGTISSNTSSATYSYSISSALYTSGGGGGVSVNSGTFTKQSGGTIYGSNADTALKNTASKGDSYGHAVYVSSGSKKRDTTAGEGVSLDSTKDGAAGGWE